MKPPAFQLYAADFDMDTAAWTCLQVGVYFRLLMYEWVNGSLPGTISELARIARINPRTMHKVWSMTVEKKFTLNTENMYVNNRLELEREKQLNYRESQKEKGIKRAEKMWEGHIAVATKRLQPENSSSSSTSSSIVNPIEEPKGSLSETEKFVLGGNGKYPPCPQKEIINTYHKTLPELPRVNQWPENLQVILRTRWKEDPARQNLAWWEQFFQYVQESDFLMGRTKETFVADLEWLVRPKNFTKIANGRYHGRGNLSSKPQPGIAAWLAERSEHDQTR